MPVWVNGSRNQFDQDLYLTRKALAIQILGGHCVLCGRTEDLQFDHVDPHTKKFAITDRLRGNWETLVEELAKCQLLCMIHHEEKSTVEKRLRAPALRHGTYWAYRKHKCRCDPCMEAGARKNQERRLKRNSLGRGGPLG